MSAVPSIGRAHRVDRPATPGADAATELYERYSAQVFGYCFHHLGSREEAEDAVQTTFMNAFRGLARGIVPEAEQAWVFKIAHNVCLSRRRSSWRRGRVEAPNNMEVLQEVVPAKDKVADELIRLQDVLETMPENQRRAILLREWQGLSYREIADELDLSQAAVETLIFRARRALASGLEDAPLERIWRKRLRRGLDLGTAAAFLKTLFGGGGAAAVKVGTVVALAGATVATTAVDHMHAQARTDAQAAKTAGGVAQQPAPRTVSSASVASTSAAASYPVELRRDASPHVTPAHATSQPKAPATPAPETEPPAPAASEPEPAAAAPLPAVAASPPADAKPLKAHGRSANPGRPAPTPDARPGNGKGRDKAPPPTSEPAPPAPAADAPPAAPGNSGDHGHDAAPGQQSKPDQGAHGNGRAK